MRSSQYVRCETFPCPDVRHERFAVPGVTIRPEDISVIMISEAAPENPADNYYAKGEPLFAQTTLQAFEDAGVRVQNVKDLLGMGVYLTTAIKCAKTGYAIQTGSVKQCSLLLERELALFPQVKVILLMGDVAIRAVNEIARRAGEGRVIPAGSTYKIRGQEYFWRGVRVFPSYLQAGPSFFIEKSKRRVIAEDIAAAMRLTQE
jgi:uracil-DNA glycosylase